MSANKRILLRDLFVMEQLPSIEVIKSLQKDGVIANSTSCAKCKRNRTLVYRDDLTDKFSWRCSKCGSRKSIRSGSWFSTSRLTLPKILQLTYMWVAEFRNKDVVRELELSEDTVVNWFNFCREVCVEILLIHEKEKIGGPGIIVEIDESKFGKRKYNRGKHVDGQWVFGGIERDSGKCFLEVVVDRTSNTLISLIQTNIKDGTIIISDCWKAYEVLSKMDYEHLTVNHSITFKNSETGAHTNNIKSAWSCVKRSLPQANRSKAMFSSYLAAFMYRRLRKNSFDPYRQFLTDISRVYNPAQPKE